MDNDSTIMVRSSQQKRKDFIICPNDHSPAASCYLINILFSIAREKLSIHVVALVASEFLGTSFLSLAQSFWVRSRGRALLSNNYTVILRFQCRLANITVSVIASSPFVPKLNHDFEEKKNKEPVSIVISKD